MTPEQIKECRKVLKKIDKDYSQKCIGSHDLDYQYENERQALSTALTALDELEKKGAEKETYKIDAAHKEMETFALDRKIKELEAELERVRGALEKIMGLAHYQDGHCQAIAKSTLESREGGKE